MKRYYQVQKKKSLVVHTFDTLAAAIRFLEYGDHSEHYELLKEETHNELDRSTTREDGSLRS